MTEPEQSKSSASESDELCVVCYERPSGWRLQPCGHDCFCQACSVHFRKCPLCRRPLHVQFQAAQAAWSPTGQQTEESTGPSVASKEEMWCFAGVWLAVWLMVFVAGLVEFYHGVPAECAPGCEYGSSSSSRCHCEQCLPGFFNGGAQCFERLEDLPPVETGGGLGGSTYFSLVVITQALGCLVEVCLIWRLHRRRLLPRKELVVLATALLLEVTRMALVDAVMLEQYFSGRAFSIFRAPDAGLLCQGANHTWTGADGQLFCEPPTLATASDTKYYIATHREAFVADLDVCSTFTRDSALLDFTRGQGVGGSGFNRFSRMGWVVGGQFGLIYFFATFVNEVADIIFVVPTSSLFGWRCKLFSVALEFFQLGALCPAAIFTHTDCLRYEDPLGISLHVVREIMVTNCFLVWGFVLTCMPLAFAGLVLVMLLACVSSGLWAVVLGSGRIAAAIHRCQSAIDGSREDNSVLRLSAFLGMASVPTLVSGIFLGVLVVAGQGSKKGFSQVLTGVVLFSDVAFKVGATVVTEALDYALHRRVRRAMATRERPTNSPAAAVVGAPALTLQSATDAE